MDERKTKEVNKKNKQEAWRKYRGRKTAFHRERYNNARNMVTREVRAAKHVYEKRVVQDAAKTPNTFGVMFDQGLQPRNV